MAMFDNIMGRKIKSNPINAYKYEKEVSKQFEIVETTPTRIEPTVDAFIAAREGAASKIIQSRVQLYDLYNATMTIDSYVIGLIEKRLDNIGNKRVVLYKDGEVVEDYREFFKAPKFRQFMKDIVLTQFWGMGLFEFHKETYNGNPWFDYFKIPIKHINPYKEVIIKNQFEENGQSYRDKDNLLFIGDKDDLGLLSPITILSIYKRLSYSDYARYSELASENFTISSYRTTDMDNIQRIEQALANRGKGGSLSIPEGVNVRQENQSSSQQNELFRDYSKMLKEDLAVFILGQTMTTSDGSSRAQAEVHQIEQDSKYTKDEQFVLDTLNYDFIDYLKVWGIDDTKNAEFKFEVNTDAEVSKRIEQYKSLKELGVVFSDAELRDKFKDII